jgi:hypothetical protein
MSKYYIRTGYYNRIPDDVSRAVTWGYSRTLERAILRAEKMSKNIRTDCVVFVDDGQRVLAKSGTNEGPGGVCPRKLRLV